jgi:hypothetical protein
MKRIYKIQENYIDLEQVTSVSEVKPEHDYLKEDGQRHYFIVRSQGSHVPIMANSYEEANALRSELLFYWFHTANLVNFEIGDQA